MLHTNPKYPIGEQDFKSLREEGFIYVDKTRYVYELTHSNKYYFLSRPRRFGKSLLLSTLRYYFEGRKDLFEGLAIDKLETEWKKHPVMHLSLARFNPDNPESLNQILSTYLSSWEEKYNIDTEKITNFSERFARIIKKSSEDAGNGVVILIDEYDAPLLSTLHDNAQHEKLKSLLKSFYTNIKDNAEYIRFVMLTGVSRFSHMSIFSGLNNLQDITLLDKYSGICGITQEELIQYFHTGIEKMAYNETTDNARIIESLKNYYDGYHFSIESPDIFNPFSLLNAFAEGRLGSYWMRTGTPTFLIKRLVEERIDLNEIFNSHATDQSLAENDLSYSSIVALMFQTGYLTIKGYEPRRKRYKLGIPNKEVSEGIFENLMKECQYKNTAKGRDIIYNISDALYEGNPQQALTEMRSYLGGIGYPQGNTDREFAFQNNLLIPLKLLGMDVHNELHISSGRIDMEVTTDKYIYLFEFKLNKTAEEALRQIKEKDYGVTYQTDRRKLFLIGVNFSSKKRNIDSWIIE